MFLSSGNTHCLFVILPLGGEGNFLCKISFSWSKQSLSAFCLALRVQTRKFYSCVLLLVSYFSLPNSKGLGHWLKCISNLLYFCCMFLWLFRKTYLEKIMFLFLFLYIFITNEVCYIFTRAKLHFSHLFSGTGNVLKVQHLLHICSEHDDSKDHVSFVAGFLCHFVSSDH